MLRSRQDTGQVTCRQSYAWNTRNSPWHPSEAQIARVAGLGDPAYVIRCFHHLTWYLVSARQYEDPEEDGKKSISSHKDRPRPRHSRHALCNPTMTMPNEWLWDRTGTAVANGVGGVHARARLGALSIWHFAAKRVPAMARSLSPLRIERANPKWREPSGQAPRYNPGQVLKKNQWTPKQAFDHKFQPIFTSPTPS
ncbi:uncharacterized protein CLUP02_10891 [Colletotrichum lupini]|uniref:Uncharacterized protein n=1 Tax=Colletotrichum lupini TaxID=145971 RepID=A0A9Q8SXF7_9PEZI|nr:uncharacterized protein CLUP02_10891 [Colletotrichum lupini]UQC85394.1 hypothetical protein CLUP02_10891 [Colletotrichum lupini]